MFLSRSDNGVRHDRGGWVEVWPTSKGKKGVRDTLFQDKYRIEGCDCVCEEGGE